MAPDSASVPVLVITGPVGVGKSTVAWALSDLLAEKGAPHAMLDMDWLRWSYPRPSGDPFHMALGLRDLAAVWRNYRDAGATRLVLVDIVESRADRAAYQSAIPCASIVVARLYASLPTIVQRLRDRETGASLAWHEQRAGELLRIMEREKVEDWLVIAEGRRVEEIAQELMARWLGAGG